jgi:hypothetical protein
MSRLLIGIISGVGGLIIGGFGGRKTSNVTIKDVKAVPGKGMSAVFSGVKWAGRKIGSGLSPLAFWKKKKEVKKGKVNLKQDFQNLTVKHQELSGKYTKLSDDFSETAKRMGLVKIERDNVIIERDDKEELLSQEIKKNAAFQNTVIDKDTELTKAATDLKQETVDKQKAISDLKVAQGTIAKLQKATPEN